MNENSKKLMAVMIALAGFVTVIFAAIYFLNGSKSKGPIVLHYWGLWEPPEVMQPLIDEYEQAHPNIKIEYVQKHFSNVDVKYVYKGAYQDAVEERLKRSGGVDIMRIHYTWVAKYLKYLYPAPSNLLTASLLKQDFYPALVDGVSTSTGKVYGMPLYIDGLVLFYNKKLLKESGYVAPPQTWDDAIAYAKTLTKRNANGDIVQAGLAMGAVNNVLHSPYIILLMFTQAGIPVVDPAAGHFNLESDEASAALEFYFSFQRKEGVWDYRLPTDLELFAQGKLAMMIAPAWRIQDVVGLNPSLEFDIAPVPVLAGANPSAPQYVADYWVEVVPRNSKHPKEAWEFLNWLSQPEQLRKLYANEAKIRLMGEPYPRISMAEELKDTPYASTVIQMAPSMKAWILFDVGLWEEQFKKVLGPVEAQNFSYPQVLRSINENLNNFIFPQKK